MNIFQGDLWGCVGPGPGPGREGQRGVCSPTGPTGPASSMPRRRSRGGWGGTEPPRHVSGRPRGRSSRSREDARGEPLSPGAAAAASLRLCHFCVTAVLRAPLVGAPTSEPRYLPEELFWGGSAHGAPGREGAPPPGKALCGPSESRVIKLRLLRAASSVPGSRAFEVGVRIFLLNE